MAEVTLIQKYQIVEKSTLLEKIQRNNTKEQKVIKELDKKDSHLWEEDGIVYIKERIYVLNNRKMQEQILQENHDTVDVRHPEQ